MLGIHASSLDVLDRDPDQDERLALNTAWYASLIPEMLPSHCTVRVGGARHDGSKIEELRNGQSENVRRADSQSEPAGS